MSHDSDTRYEGLSARYKRRRAQIDTLIDDGVLSQDIRTGEWVLSVPSENTRNAVITAKTAREAVQIGESWGLKFPTKAERDAEAERNRRIVARAYAAAGITPPETSIAHGMEALS